MVRLVRCINVVRAASYFTTEGRVVMATFLARKLFSRTCSITGGAAISLASLMRAAPAVTGTTAWGKNTDGTVSLDSFEANAATVTPLAGDLYMGYDAQVADADAAATYKGAYAAVNTPFDLAAWCRGIVDAENVYLYSPSTQSLNIVFQGF